MRIDINEIEWNKLPRKRKEEFLQHRLDGTIEFDTIDLFSRIYSYEKDPEVKKMIEKKFEELLDAVESRGLYGLPSEVLFGQHVAGLPDKIFTKAIDILVRAGEVTHLARARRIGEWPDVIEEKLRDAPERAEDRLRERTERDIERRGLVGAVRTLEGIGAKHGRTVHVDIRPADRGGVQRKRLKR